MASQPPAQPHYPPLVIDYIIREIARRTEYKRQLEQTPVYKGYVDFTRRKNEQERDRLESAIAKLTTDVLAICKRHFPDIEVDPNPEVTISNVLASLPTPDEVKRIRVISSRLGAPG
jgi:hypothetical protein